MVRGSWRVVGVFEGREMTVYAPPESRRRTNPDGVRGGSREQRESRAQRLFKVERRERRAEARAIRLGLGVPVR